jgi:plasmid stability protein
VNLSIKNVPDALAAKLRKRAERNHRSLQGELMVLLETAVAEPNAPRASAPAAPYTITPALASSLLETLTQIASQQLNTIDKPAVAAVATPKQPPRTSGL